MIDATQIRMARAALGWGVRDLARAAGVAANTVSRIENHNSANSKTLLAIKEAFEKCGVVFVSHGEASLQGGSGVRFIEHIKWTPVETE